MSILKIWVKTTDFVCLWQTWRGSKLGAMKKLLLCFVLLQSTLLSAQYITPSVFDQLTGQEVLEMELITDINQLLISQNAEAKYQAAQIRYENEDGRSESWNLKIKVRGKFRRTVCDFPPITLDFKRDDLKARGLSKHDKLKLVTHCADDRALGTSLLLREYLAYRLYQEVSPYSYRVQLVRIHYIDSDGAVSGIRRYGFIIEDTDEMAERIGGQECDDCQYPDASTLDADATRLHAMFQYLIGNSDYSIPVVRNVKLIRRQGDGQLIPVGYDFDFSGLVSAPYALPATHMGQLAIKQRIYLGLPETDSKLGQTIRYFLDKKEALLEEVDQLRLLPRSQRQEVREYLLTFFDQMEGLQAGQAVDLYQRIRQEHPMAVPDGANPLDYRISER